MKNTRYIAMMLLIIISAAGMIAACTNTRGCSKEGKLCNDGTMVARGGPNCEFERCPNEKNEISGKMSSAYTKEIITPKGSLFLTYSQGKSTITGALDRISSCTKYDLQIISTKDMPISNVNINIDDNKCAELIEGEKTEPQEISMEIPSVSENTHYTFTFEKTEKLFDGKLGGN